MGTLSLSVRKGRRLRLKDNRTGEILGWITLGDVRGSWARLWLNLAPDVVVMREELLPEKDRFGK